MENSSPGGDVEGLVDSSRHSPAINPTAFPNTPSEVFWTASKNSPDMPLGDVVLIIHFDSGMTFWEFPYAQGQTPRRVRCVKGAFAPPAPHYTAGTATVTDQRTGLAWQRAIPSLAHSNSNAALYRQNLSPGGFASNWRQHGPRSLRVLGGSFRWSSPPERTRTVIPCRDARPGGVEAAFPNRIGLLGGVAVRLPEASHADTRQRSRERAGRTAGHLRTHLA